MRANRGSEKLLDGHPYEPLLQRRFGSNELWERGAFATRTSHRTHGVGRAADSPHLQHNQPLGNRLWVA